MGGSVTGSDFDARGLSGFFMDAEWTGTSPVGTLYLEGVIDPGDTYKTLASWPISGNTGSETLNYSAFKGGRIRARYARTSGTGTLNVKFNLKE